MTCCPRSQRFFQKKGGGPALHALHWGEVGRPPLVLLHGGGANAHWWDHLAPCLADLFHVVALDFRGHGESEFPEELTPGAFGADVEAHRGARGLPTAASHPGRALESDSIPRSVEQSPIHVRLSARQEKIPSEP